MVATYGNMRDAYVYLWNVSVPWAARTAMAWHLPKIVSLSIQECHKLVGQRINDPICISIIPAPIIHSFVQRRAACYTSVTPHDHGYIIYAHHIPFLLHPPSSLVIHINPLMAIVVHRKIYISSHQVSQIFTPNVIVSSFHLLHHIVQPLYLNLFPRISLYTLFVNISTCINMSIPLSSIMSIALIPSHSPFSGSLNPMNILQYDHIVVEYMDIHMD